MYPDISDIAVFWYDVAWRASTKRSILYVNHFRADVDTCYFMSPCLGLNGELYNCYIIVINDENQFTGDKP